MSGSLRFEFFRTVTQQKNSLGTSLTQNSLRKRIPPPS